MENDLKAQHARAAKSGLPSRKHLALLFPVGAHRDSSGKTSLWRKLEDHGNTHLTECLTHLADYPNGMKGQNKLLRGYNNANIGATLPDHALQCMASTSPRALSRHSLS